MVTQKNSIVSLFTLNHALKKKEMHHNIKTILIKENIPDTNPGLQLKKEIIASLMIRLSNNIPAATAGFI